MSEVLLLPCVKRVRFQVFPQNSNLNQSLLNEEGRLSMYRRVYCLVLDHCAQLR